MPIPEPTKRRGPIYAEYTGPGPCGYTLPPTVGGENADPTKRTGPSFTLKPRLPDLANKNPGPEYIIDPHVTSKGKQDGLSFSLFSRPKQKPIEILPGPGAYNMEKVKQGVVSTEANGRRITLASRNKYAFKDEAPPPNSYTHPVGVGNNAIVCKGAPKYTLKARLQVGKPEYNTIKANIPGPGAYRSSNPDNVKREQPSYSMQGRTKVKDYKTTKDNPGPGSYNPSKPKNQPSFSMGVRHSDYILRMVGNLDLV